MKHFLILLVFIIISFSSYAGEKVYPAYKIPTDSPLKIKRVEKIPPFLFFSGKAEIRAKYTFSYLADAYKPYVELIIEPVNNSLNKLPFLVQRGRDEKPLKVSVFEVKKAAKLLLGTEMAEKIINGKHPSISGEANIIIYNFGAGYECDKAVYIAKLKSVNNHFTSAKIGGVNAYSGC